MTLNVLNGSCGRETVISPRSAAKYLGISPGLFFTEMRAGTLQWQTRIDGDSPTAKPAYGFEVKYLEEIKPLLDTHRKGSKRLFTDDVKTKIQKINKRWPANY
jgi:hypothetical protein